MERIQKVLANCEQGLDTAAQAQARANIGAQAQLTPGQNISIVDNVISATNTTYTAGNGISIANNVVSVKTKAGGVLGDISFWNGYSIAPCGAFNGSTLVWPVES